MADMKEIMNTVDTTGAFDPEDIQKNKWVCALAYISILFFLPLVVCPKSKYGKFHANQALVLLLVSVVGNVLLAILGALLGIIKMGFLVTIVEAVWGLALLLLLITGILNVVSGKAKELPVIGGIKIIHVN